MWLRLGAYFVDGSLASLAAIAIWYALTTAGYLQAGESEALDRLQNNLLYTGILLGYMVFAQTFYHTTIGKYVFGLEIASARNGGRHPGFGVILLRETIGKFCSAIVFGIGYWRAIRDPRKQTWHDQMADTVVRKGATNPALRKQLAALAVMAVVACLGIGVYAGWIANAQRVQQNRESAAEEFKRAVQECDAARESMLSVSKLPWDTWAALQERDRTLLTRADEYGTELQTVSDLTHRALRKELYLDYADFKAYEFLQKVYKLRQDQNKKLQDEIHIILATSQEAPDFEAKVSAVKMMDSEITNIDNEVASLNGQFQQARNQYQ